MQSMNSMQDLMANMLEGIYTAEQDMLQSMPMIMEHIESPELRKLFENHEQETEQQCQRLEQIFQKMGKKLPKNAKSPIVQGLIKECQDMIKAGGDEAVLEAGLILAAQKMEHIEIAGYGTAVEFAKMIGDKQSAKLLAQTLDEEEKTDKKLTKVARNSINPKAKSGSSKKRWM